MARTKRVIFVLASALVAYEAPACSLMSSFDGLTRKGPEDGGGDTATSPPDPNRLTCEPSRGEKLCFGVCGSVNDPRVGCSAESCLACDPKNVDVSLCQGSADGFGCSYGACDARHLDCDGDRRNGCETSKISPSSCGQCDVRCVNATPFCAFIDGDFVCAATCPSGTKACDGACVDVMTDVDNCGDCAHTCVQQGATARCESGSCKFTCQNGLKDCGGRCAPALDPATCGPGCTPCAAPGQHQQVLCAETGCNYTCDTGTFDCDLDRANGCESTVPCNLVAPAPDCAKLGCSDGCCAGKGCVPLSDPCLGGGGSSGN